ncbi:MAG: hypothetical protein HZA61_01565 [Candidatus Eisenbacteria bacterium]|uniref:Dam-replacing protein HTH domain-containing protein n=1 Tax=Eiseniibacteriota bacterium TaxID=2212470 RepID=A0A933S9G3_UNCEI|nr:hypothetical protein [Candidatus Eisenbacteria bacterium]
MGAPEWLAEIRKVIDRLPESFALKDVYAAEELLQATFPGNQHIRDKIRQQLQLLRDSGELVFLGSGHYQRVRNT